jgi:hypothetical protein
MAEADNLSQHSKKIENLSVEQSSQNENNQSDSENENETIA